MEVSTYWEARKKAYSAVLVAVLQKRLPVVTTLSCADCGEQAQVYHHHNGYGEANLLDVIPLCNSCHRTRHWNARRVEVGLRLAGNVEGEPEGMKQIGVHVEESLHRAFKVACVQEGKDMSEILRELIECWLIERKQKQEMTGGDAQRSEVNFVEL